MSYQQGHDEIPSGACYADATSSGPIYFGKMSIIYKLY